MIDIKDSKGNIVVTIPINEGAKGKFSLGGEDYVILPFYSSEPVFLPIGSSVDFSGILDESLGGKFAKRYEIVEPTFPTYDDGCYKYDLRLDAYYMKWKNKVFKYIPEDGGQEASWSLTAPLSAHLNIVKRNLAALGYTFNGISFTYSIDSIEDKTVALTYSNVSIWDALVQMAQYCDCDLWVTEHVIHFGRCEAGDYVDVEIGKHASSMPRSDSSAVFVTRAYAFGSTKNLPKNYRPSTGDVVGTGVVEKHLMLPAGTPYVDAYRYRADGSRVYVDEDGYDAATKMPQAEAVEGIIVFDGVFPRTDMTVGKVGSYDSTVNDEDGTSHTETFYYVTDTSGMQFDESYVLGDGKLTAQFKSGHLNSLEFSITFRKKGTTLDGVELTEDVYEIVANENYGRKLPDGTLKPQAGDKFILIGWDATKLPSSGLIEKAEQELKSEAEKYVGKTVYNDGTFSTTLLSGWVEEDMQSRMFALGQRINLINKSLFRDSRKSRVIGYEIKLDLPYDEPVFEMGESGKYSRLEALEQKVDAQSFYGNAAMNSGANINGGGSSIYIIRVNDSTAASDTNVYSARRSDMQNLRKDRDDTAAGTITFLREARMQGGAMFGKTFIPGLYGIGGRIDGAGYGELRGLRLWEWLEVPEIRFNRIQYVLGLGIRAKGGGIIEDVVIDTTTDSEGNTVNAMTGGIYLKLEDGEYGAVDVDDMHMGLWHDLGGGNATEHKDDHKGTYEMKGFKTVYFRVTDIPATDPDGKDNSDNHYFRYVLRPLHDGGNGVHPYPMMHFGGRGNFSKKDRQNFVYETTEYEMKLTGVNTWVFQDSNIYYISGILDGFTMEQVGDDGQTYIKHFEGYGTVLGNAYIYGAIDMFERAAVTMEIDTQGLRDLAYGESVLMTCNLKKAGFDVTDKVTRWDISRDTGDPAEDAAWALKPKVKAFNGSMMLSFTDSDNDLGMKIPVTVFTIKAYQNDEQIAEAVLSV